VRHGERLEWCMLILSPSWQLNFQRLWQKGQGLSCIIRCLRTFGWSLHGTSRSWGRWIWSSPGGPAKGAALRGRDRGWTMNGPGCSPSLPGCSVSFKHYTEPGGGRWATSLNMSQLEGTSDPGYGSTLKPSAGSGARTGVGNAAGLTCPQAAGMVDEPGGGGAAASGAGGTGKTC
jgi:hypothetical protein